MGLPVSSGNSYLVGIMTAKKRVMGIEPTVSSFEGWRSAIELHPTYSLYK